MAGDEQPGREFEPVEASLLVPVPLATAWGVLTDYDRLASFVPGLKVSRCVNAPGEPLLLEQQGETLFMKFRFRIEVFLRVTERPFDYLRFDLERGNMRHMTGEWHLADLGEGTRVTYKAVIVPSFGVPPVVGPKVIRKSVDDQLRGLAAEMNRRGDAVAPGNPS